ncbi:MAG: hypothetical protein HY924_05850 [Elusimicrobia bacterium]|nr:hypothetical protein [Elusimicrobiota bacterium]
MKGKCCEKLKRHLMTGVDHKRPFSCPKWRKPPKEFCACCKDLIRTFGKTIKTVRLQGKAEVPSSVRLELRKRLAACAAGRSKRTKT